MFNTGKKAVALFLVMALAAPAFAGIGSKKALYVGGTLPEVKEQTEGELQTGDEAELRFVAKGQSASIPYGRVTGLEYGQKAGRRVGATILAGLALGVFALPILFSKKRKHFLTVGYSDEAGKEQVAVFELGKDVVRPTLAVVEARAGKKVEYQDDEARKSAKGN